MADQADVEAAILTVINAAVYPEGVGSPSTLGPDVRLYRGWPQNTALNTDLVAGRVNISIFPVSGTERMLTPLPGEWAVPAVPPGLLAGSMCETAFFSGEPGAGEVAGILVDGVAYRYETVAGDTARSVAAAMAQLIRIDRSALLLNATLRVPGARELTVRVAGFQRATREIRRQSLRFRVTLWCPTPALRDAAAALVDQTLALIRFLGLPDGSAARLLSAGSETSDQNANGMLYRRDLLVDAEYATTISELLPSMLFGGLNLNKNERLV